MNQPITPTQRRKLQKLSNILMNGEVAVLEHLLEIEEKVDQAVANMEAKVEELKDVAEPNLKELLKSIRGKDGDSIQGDPGEPGMDGENYFLTETDISDISNEVLSNIKLPVEKIIERTEVVHEQPITLETKTTVENPVTPVQVRDKLESLKAEERLDVSALKGFTQKVSKIADALVNRAISILDQRTSFLINKVTNLQTQLNNFSTTSGGSFNTETPVGTVNAVNTTFTVSNTPKAVIIDGLYKVSGFGYTYAAGTITTDSDNPPVSYIRSIY